MKKRLRKFFLLTVCALLVGCGKQKAETNAGTESTMEMETVREETEQTTTQELKRQEDTVSQERTELQTEAQPETPESEEDTKPQSGGNEQLPQTEQEREETDKTELEQQTEVQPEPVKPETPEPTPEMPEPVPETSKQEPETEKAEPISYSPQKVAELAVEKTKAQGKVYIPDDLDRMLAAGEISQEDYNACYPTDGAGYLEYFVAANMNEARDISGTVRFNSEEDIAANIAGVYAALPQQYFYIEYHGTVMYDGKECHVFYCYRA